MPAPFDRAAAPSVTEILRHVAERAHAEEVANGPESYLCVKQTVTEEYDSEGHVTSRNIKVGETHSGAGGAADASKWSTKNGFSLDRELLERYQFTVSDRVLLDGRPTWVLTFVPKENPPVRHIQDRIINRAMGTVWVDEKDSEVVKANICLGRPISFGILGALHEFTFSFERTRVDDGQWLTRWTDTLVNARKFFTPIRTHKRVDCSDFRRLASN